jgi:hypothetical protein
VTTPRADTFVRQNEVQHAITESVNGRSGHNVFAMNSKMEWQRINAVRTHRALVYGHSLNSGKWFVIHQWEER